jgi:TatD DNase family protein
LDLDAPWCEIRPTHAAFKHIKTHFEWKKKERWDDKCFVKSRNEPAAIVQVMEVLSSIRGEDIATLAEHVYMNTRKLFNS